MKLLKFSLILLVAFMLIGCKTNKSIKTDLEDEGWSVTIVDEDSLDKISDALGEGIMESNVKSVIMAIKGLKVGFVLEFKNHSDAKAYYNQLIEIKSSGVHRRGKLVILSDSDDFLDIVN